MPLPISIGALNCRLCNEKCNQKGYESAMKDSAFCESQRGIISQVRQGFLNKIRQNRYIQKFNKHYRKARGR